MRHNLLNYVQYGSYKRMKNTLSLIVANKMIAWLFHKDQEFKLTGIQLCYLFYSKYIYASHAFRKAFFEALQNEIAAIENNASLDIKKKEILSFNVLAFLGYTHPEDGDFVTIRDQKYTIEKIQLTSGWLSSPYYFYGLTLVADPEGQAICIFPGTTVASDRGFLAGLLADTRPGGAIGAGLYERGKKKIQNWINETYQKTNKPVLCVSESLGGGISLRAYVEQPDKVDYCLYNPVSLTQREENIYENKKLSSNSNSCKLMVIRHRSEFAFNLGSRYLPPDTNFILHGDENGDSIETHERGANFNDEFLERQPKPEIKRNKIWESVKPLLFGVLVLFLQAPLIFPRAIMEISKKIVRAIQLDTNNLQPLETRISDINKLELTDEKLNSSKKEILRTINALKSTATPDEAKKLLEILDHTYVALNPATHLVQKREAKQALQTCGMELKSKNAQWKLLGGLLIVLAGLIITAASTAVAIASFGAGSLPAAVGVTIGVSTCIAGIATATAAVSAITAGITLGYGTFFNKKSGHQSECNTACQKLGASAIG